MPEISSNNKRIAQNTLFLYFRTFIIMIVSLYTVRVVLQALGEEDYGIYNVVGGIVVMFSFLSKVLASASQRFFAFELGQGNHERLRQIFSITQILYVIVIIVIIIVTEVFGIWFLQNKATIPDDRMMAASLILQFSIVSFSITLFATPYQADIIAHERMNVYAYVGILEAVLQLLLAFALKFVPITVDVLIVYGVLMLVNSIIVQGAYMIYARKCFEEARFRYYWDSILAKEILSYSGWNIFGALASVVRSQGLNMLISMFFNPAINAARGVAYQINNAINHFASNFYTAVRPQVTKNYAKGDMDATLSLVFSSSKFTYYLLLFVAVPIMVFAEPILELWLDVVPEHTLLFTELVIIVALIDSISNPLMTLAQATGRVGLYQSVVGTLLIMVLPVSYIFLRMDYPAEVTMVVSIVISAVSLFARLVILRYLVSFPIRKYILKVLLRLSVPTVLSFGIVYLMKAFVLPNSESIVVFLIKVVMALAVTIGIILLTGFTQKEKSMVFNIIKNRLPSKKKP